MTPWSALLAALLAVSVRAGNRTETGAGKLPAGNPNIVSLPAIELKLNNLGAVNAPLIPVSGVTPITQALVPANQLKIVAPEAQPGVELQLQNPALQPQNGRTDAQPQEVSAETAVHDGHLKFDGAGAVKIELGMDAGRGGQADSLPDLSDGRWVPAVAVDLEDVVQDRMLSRA